MFARDGFVESLEAYLGELRAILSRDFEGYRRVEMRRVCERLLQIPIEAVIDICGLVVASTS